MKTKHLHIPALVLMLTSSLLAEAYTITGRIIDGSNNAPLRKAVIIARNDSSKVLAGLESDQNGIFVTGNVNAEKAIIEISREGYESRYLQVAGDATDQLNIGTVALTPQKNVTLKEVEVTAQSVIQKPDRYIILPSKDEIRRASSAVSLLNELQMKMPGLRVIEELQSITVENRTPVFKINGKPADLNKILSINNDNILRIEYFDNPDIRYNNTVINFILKPRRDGGSFMTDITSAVTTKFLNGNIGGTYYDRKSEWNLNYGINWRDYNNRVVNTEEQFIGREYPIIRKTDGIPSKLGYTDNNLSLGYTYMHNENTMFSVTIGGGTSNPHLNDAYIKSQQYGDEKSSYESRTSRNSKVKNPYLDLFFKKQMKNNQVLEVNAFGSYSKSDFDREYSDTYDDASKNFSISSIIDNKYWRAGGELMYAKQFKNFTTTFGLRDAYSHSSTNNVENDTRTSSKLHSNDLYFYGQIVGRIKKFGYSIGVGGNQTNTSNGSESMSAIRAKINAVLNYQFSKKFSLNYLFMYNPSMPSLSMQSDVINRIDDVSLQQGNIDLVPSTWYRNRLYARYTQGKFTSTFWVSHSRTVNPIYYNCTYIGNPSDQYYDMFLNRIINGRHDDRINLQLDLGVQNLLKHASLFCTIGWDGYTLDMGNKKYNDRRLYASIYGALYFGNWTISANYVLKPQYSLSGNTFTRQERFDVIRVQYHWKDWYFKISGCNMFTKRGSIYRSIKYSDVNPSESEVYIKDNANQVTLGVTYRINFGKSFRKANRSIKNGGGDSGININY